MADLGWGVVDCDKLGHEAYTPGAVAFQKIVEEFGNQVVAEDGTIDRRALGGIVFSEKGKLKKLNEIVWPEIARLAKEKAQELWDVVLVVRWWCWMLLFCLRQAGSSNVMR